MAELRHIVEAALLAAGEPVPVDRLRGLFEAEQRPTAADVRAALSALQQEYTGRGLEVSEVASGFRIQVAESCVPWIAGLWAERPPRYSRAVLETLAIIAYRQPITRGEIEEIRGVSISAGIMRTLQERGWIRVLGQRDVPGRPELLGTTRAFLDYFDLKSLDELPSLMALQDTEQPQSELDLEAPGPEQP